MRQAAGYILAAVAMLAMPRAAGADETLVLKGLFCKTNAQLEEALAHIRADVDPSAAAALTNRGDVACVYADRIAYVVDRPILLGQTPHFGRKLYRYEAAMVGAVVGGRPRPVTPAVRMFFVLPYRIAGAGIERGA
jgi:hypothetical protein